MKKNKHKITLLLAACLPLLSQAQKNDYTVSGQLTEITAGKIYLRYIENGNRIVDSTLLQNGKFEFKGQIIEPVSAQLVYSNGENNRKGNIDSKSIFLEKGLVKIEGKNELKSAAIIGGPENKEYNELQDKLKPSQEKTQSFYKSYTALSKEEKEDTSKVKPLERGIDEQEGVQQQEYLAFLKKHKNSFVALEAVKRYAGYTIDYDKVNPVFSSLSTPIKNSITGKAFNERLQKVEKISIGRMAPEFTQNDTNGHPFQLASLRGKYVLVDFWASWCGPCRAENPNVVKAFNKYKDHDFTVLGVSLDQPNGKENWLNAIHHDQLIWNQVSDLKFWNNEVAQLYAVQSIPQNFLLDPSGKIIAKNLRGEDLDKKLSSILISK